MKRTALIGILAAAWLLSAIPAHAEKKELQGFSVVLVLGETQGAMPTDGLSAGAKKALADLRDFLPYKGYRVLDTQWIAGAVGAPGSPHVDGGRLRGLDNQDYDFRIIPHPGQERGLDFSLRMADLFDEAARNRETARISVLEDRVWQARQKVGSDRSQDITAAQQDLTRARRIAATPQTLIATTINIDVGETVVVGTSRVQGDKALIVLLTAVAK